MGVEKQINIRDFVGDIRGAMSSFQLMKKYDLSLFGLVQALSRLVNARAIELGELRRLLPIEKQEVILYQQRQVPRSLAQGRVLVCDLSDPTTEGCIGNITEEGFQVKGIPAKVGETKSFLIAPEDLIAVRSFAVEAECRWAKPGFGHEETISGYRINTLSEQARTELRKLVLGGATEAGSTYWQSFATEEELASSDSDTGPGLAERVEHATLLKYDVSETGSFDTRMEVELFSHVLNGFAMPCFLIDETYRIIFANEFSLTLGLERDQLVGASFLKFFPGTADSVRSFMDQVLFDRVVLTFVAWMNVFQQRYFVRSCFRSLRCENRRLLLVALQDFTDAIQKMQSTESRVNELLGAYKEVLANLATNEATLHQRDQVMHLVIDSVGQRLKEERQRLIFDVGSHLKPIINRLKAEKMSERGASLLNTLEILLDEVGSVCGNRMPGVYNVLTPRETEVCDLILAGHGSKEIAETLGLSLETVTTHRSKIRKKLGLVPGQSIYNALKARMGGLTQLTQSKSFSMED